MENNEEGDDDHFGVVSLCVPEHARHIHKSLHLSASRELTPVRVIERLAVVLPSHWKPSRPQMKSEQLWQKVGLVRVTLFRQWPGRPEGAGGLEGRRSDSAMSWLDRTGLT